MGGVVLLSRAQPYPTWHSQWSMWPFVWSCPREQNTHLNDVLLVELFMMAAHFGAWRPHIARVVFDMDDREANKPETRRQPDRSRALWAVAFVGRVRNNSEHCVGARAEVPPILPTVQVSGCWGRGSWWRLTLVRGCGWVWRWWSRASAIWGWVFSWCQVEVRVDGT